MKKLTVFLLFFVLISFTFAGVEWKSKVTAIDENNHENEMTIHSYAQDGNVKVNYENVTNEKAGMYQSEGIDWLYRTKENTMYIINHEEKTVMPMEIDQMLQISKATAGVVKIEIKDYEVKHETLAPENILGYKCSHIKIITDYIMKVKITVFKKTFKVHEEKEIWGTKNIKGLEEISKSFINKEYKTGFEEMDKMIEEQTGLYEKVGFPLKTITFNQQKNKKGTKALGESTTTTEVIEFKTKPLDSSMFEVPEDYEVVKSPLAQDKEKKKVKLKDIF